MTKRCECGAPIAEPYGFDWAMFFFGGLYALVSAGCFLLGGTLLGGLLCMG